MGPVAAVSSSPPVYKHFPPGGAPNPHAMIRHTPICPGGPKNPNFVQKTRILSRLGELLNTQKNVHFLAPPGDGGCTPRPGLISGFRKDFLFLGGYTEKAEIGYFGGDWQKLPKIRRISIIDFRFSPKMPKKGPFWPFCAVTQSFSGKSFLALF